MKINWEVRIKNPLWWAQMACAVVLPILAYFGLAWEDMTSWAALGDIFVAAVQNPVVVVAVLVSVFNALTDPTTAGVSDSNRAMGYVQPYKDRVVKRVSVLRSRLKRCLSQRGTSTRIIMPIMK